MKTPAPANWYSNISEVLMPLAVAMFASAKDFGTDIHFFWHEFQHILYDVHREARYGSLRDAALERLRAVHATADPFADYLPLKLPPSEELRALVIQHRLPGGGNSPWLDAWLGCLDTSSSSGVTSNRIKTNDPEFIRALARSADSNIKHNITEAFRIGESWQAFIQRLFESKWLRDFTALAVRMNAERGVPMWSFETCVGVVTAVVAVLNGSGYALVVPQTERLKSLWEGLTKGEHVSGW